MTPRKQPQEESKEFTFKIANCNGRYADDEKEQLTLGPISEMSTEQPHQQSESTLE
mgnify:CR=1 FL=1